jgi:hypothetical protein
MSMARAVSNSQLGESTDSVEQVEHEPRQPLLPLARATRSAPPDWLSEFPPEEPAMWVEVPHAHVAPPPHAAFHPFSLTAWIRSHQSHARAGALALAVVAGTLVGLVARMQRGQNPPQAVVTQSATSEPVLEPPIVTSRPAPWIDFTPQAASGPAESATTPSSLPDAASARAEVTKPPPQRATAQSDRSNTPPAPPASRDRANTSPASRVTAPPLPPAAPPARPAGVQVPPPVTDASSSSSTITTSRPPVDRAPLILSSPVREPAASPVPTPAPAPAPPPPSPEARETAAVEGVLERYRLAFSTLNSGVSDFWPSVNSRALDRAFNELEQQSFEFDKCRVQLKGGQAEATCTGKATFVPKVGNKTPRTQSRQWSFQLVRAGSRWIIDSVQSR